MPLPLFLRAGRLKIFGYVDLPVSLPGLTGQSSIPGQWLLDRLVNPPIKSGEGDDSPLGVNALERLGDGD